MGKFHEIFEKKVKKIDIQRERSEIKMLSRGVGRSKNLVGTSLIWGRNLSLIVIGFLCETASSFTRFSENE